MASTAARQRVKCDRFYSTSWIQTIREQLYPTESLRAVHKEVDSVTAAQDTMCVTFLQAPHRIIVSDRTTPLLTRGDPQILPPLPQGVNLDACTILEACVLVTSLEWCKQI